MRNSYPYSGVRQIELESEAVDNSSDSDRSGTSLVEQLMRFRPDQLTASSWAERAGLSRTIWADMRRHGNPSRRTLEKLLGVAGSSLAEFEALRVPPAAPADGDEVRDLNDRIWGWRGKPMSPIPLLVCEDAGAWRGGPLLAWSVVNGPTREHLPRPPSLAEDSDAFALIPTGSAMVPRFRTDRPIAHTPARRAREGDDVLLRLSGSEARSFVGIPGTLVGMERGCLRLTQPRPGAEMLIGRPLVQSIIVIAGELL